MIRNIIRKLVPATLQPSGHLRSLVRNQTRCRVYSGPFKGLRWIPQTDPNAEFDIPKLLGIYERELAPCMERACGLNFSLIVDVGAAEGYYAVGLAVRNPAAKVVAFEMQSKVQAELVKKATLNGVTERVQVCGKCEPQDLEQALTGADRPFVICDTEGYEVELLDLKKVPSLSRAFILVELHEFAVTGITETIQRWYALTHKITHIWQEERGPADFPFSDLYARCLPSSYLLWAVGESRPERMAWLWMEPKSEAAIRGNS
jgi:hypothetical protein